MLFSKGKKFCPVEVDPPIVRLQVLQKIKIRMVISWARGQTHRVGEEVLSKK